MTFQNAREVCYVLIICIDDDDDDHMVCRNIMSENLSTLAVKRIMTQCPCSTHEMPLYVSRSVRGRIHWQWLQDVPKVGKVVPSLLI